MGKRRIYYLFVVKGKYMVREFCISKAIFLYASEATLKKWKKKMTSSENRQTLYTRDSKLKFNFSKSFLN